MPVLDRGRFSWISFFILDLNVFGMLCGWGQGICGAFHVRHQSSWGFELIVPEDRKTQSSLFGICLFYCFILLLLVIFQLRFYKYIRKVFNPFNVRFGSRKISLGIK